MKVYLYGYYGCYLNTEHMKIEVTCPEDMTLEKVFEEVNGVMYERAYSETEGWVGQHGFDAEDEDDADSVHELVEDACEYDAVVWDEEEHAGHCTYGNGKVNTMEITLETR